MFLALKCFCIWALFTLLCISHAQNVMVPLSSGLENGKGSPRLSFSRKWLVLGPFGIGTREAVWGSDPLELSGGFRNLECDQESTFSSALASNGSVSWLHLNSNPTFDVASASVRLNIDFPAIDWASIQSVYGWSALQYQGWARGELEFTGGSPRNVVLFTEQILEFWMNGAQIFGGDFYGFRRAPVVVKVLPGRNRIDVRLVRDVRSMGNKDASVAVALEAHLASESLVILQDSFLVSDFVNERLASPLASIIICNTGDEWLEISNCHENEGLGSCDLLSEIPILFAPGQSRPVGFKLEVRNLNISKFVITLDFRNAASNISYTTSNFEVTLNRRSIKDPHKVTFLHPSGVVSYAILRPPLEAMKMERSKSALPILLNLHGAGLEADSYQVRHMLDGVSDLPAWVLFPSGMSPWSGDDWHTWGFADVKAAIYAIPGWIKTMDWNGSGALTDKWLVSGHSNGGQGTWFISSHQPDKVIAAAAASGYLSIQTYVPYTMWRRGPPQLAAIVENSLSNFRHEILTHNLKGISVLLQHGAEDDNVPPLHSRLMRALLGEAGVESNYFELPRTGHWFEGAMETEPLRDFYYRNLRNVAKRLAPPSSFSITFPSSDDMGSRWGFIADQLETPDAFGTIDVDRDVTGKTWYLLTHNIHRFHFDLELLHPELINAVFVDGQQFNISFNSLTAHTHCFIKDMSDSWEFSASASWKDLNQRYGRQRGTMDSVLRTRDTFKIVVYADAAVDIALQTSRNLLQYYGADAMIDHRESEQATGSGNLITLALGSDVPEGKLEGYPIQIKQDRVEIRRPGRAVRRLQFQPGLGAAFLRPLDNEKLELVVWGVDQRGLRQAARLIPTLTGVGQADFVILGDEARWQGYSGALAMGFFDYAWNISAASYVW